MSNELATLSFNGYDIRPDENGNISLTLLWKAAGANAYKRPADWQREDGAKYLKQVGLDLKVGITQLLIKTKGRNGGTSAIPEIALEYAKYLHPKLARLVNQVFLQRVEEEKNPELIVDRAIKTFRRRGLTDEQIAARIQGVQARNYLTSVATTHGVRGEGYRDITNAIYMPVLGGTAAQVRKRENLPEKANIRDSRPVLHLRAIEFAELLAAENIKGKNAFGNEACVNECYRAGVEVTNAVLRSRGQQPRLS
jgi:hypothetical protein